MRLFTSILLGIFIMADVWGDSWGAGWGSSWGRTVTCEPVEDAVQAVNTTGNFYDSGWGNNGGFFSTDLSSPSFPFVIGNHTILAVYTDYEYNGPPFSSSTINAIEIVLLGEYLTWPSDLQWSDTLHTFTPYTVTPAYGWTITQLESGNYTVFRRTGGSLSSANIYQVGEEFDYSPEVCLTVELPTIDPQCFRLLTAPGSNVPGDDFHGWGTILNEDPDIFLTDALPISVGNYVIQSMYTYDAFPTDRITELVGEHTEFPPDLSWQDSNSIINKDTNFVQIQYHPAANVTTFLSTSSYGTYENYVGEAPVICYTGTTCYRTTVLLPKLRKILREHNRCYNRRIERN